ncbi:LysE family translocator, partial [Leptospira sp. SA-E8]|uniref:LysE family translocator n=1 Tax=Leptospira sp. SA-E8 TaxID=3422259 RepID=UPI003EC02A1D
MPDLNWPILSAAAMFAAATSITPGPNNTMLLASGVNFGFRRTLPHILGISIGFFLLLLIAATGLNQWVLQNGTVRTGMKWLGSAYLLYLAWRVATADAQAIPRPQPETANGATPAVSASHAR